MGFYEMLVSLGSSSESNSAFADSADSFFYQVANEKHLKKPAADFHEGFVLPGVCNADEFCFFF